MNVVKVGITLSNGVKLELPIGRPDSPNTVEAAAARYGSENELVSLANRDDNTNFGNKLRPLLVKVGNDAIKQGLDADAVKAAIVAKAREVKAADQGTVSWAVIGGTSTASSTELI